MSEAKKDESDLSALLTADARIKGINPYSFRVDEWAVITGVKICTPEGCVPRPAFECTYSDGVVDHIAVSDYKNYVIGS